MDVFEASADYRSKLAAVIWIDDFPEFLVKQNHRSEGHQISQNSAQSAEYGAGVVLKIALPHGQPSRREARLQGLSVI